MRSGLWLLCVLLMVAAAGIPAQAADKWRSIRSKNFLLVGNASESAIKGVAQNLEEFRSALAAVFPGVRQESTIGTTVVVFKDDVSFRPYKPLYNGKPGSVAGYFQAGEDVNFIALAANLPSPHTIYHEFVHSLTKDTALPLPPWASEGLAEVYSMFELSGREMILGRANGDHIAVLAQQRMLPLEVLFSVGHGSPYYNEKTKQGLFYAQSWAVVHYLMFGNNGKRRPQFTKYLTLISNGKSVAENFRDAFQMEFTTLEGEIRTYVLGRVAWPAIRVKLQEKLNVDREMKSAALSEAQSQYYLGDLLLHMNRLDAAEAPLEKALQLDPRNTAAYASLGLLRIRQAKRDEALGFLARAVEGDSINHLAHYYYAYLLQQLNENSDEEVRKAQIGVIRTQLEKTIQLAPRFINAYSMLGYAALVSRERIREAEEALRKAVEYAPGRLELRVTLARLMLANDEIPAARALLTQLKNVVSEDIQRYQVELLLEVIDNRQELERALRAYNERRRELEDIAARAPAGDTVLDGRPILRRHEGISNEATDPQIIETAAPQLTVPEGIRIEGALVEVVCAGSVTLKVHAANTTVELHTENPAQVEFMSYVPNIKNSFPCGVVNPEVRVAIVYRHTTDHRFLGEPLRVDFVNPN